MGTSIDGHRDRRGREYLAQLVRVELLDDGQGGIGIHPLSLTE